jgi:serine/threonine-protein kinase
MGQPLADEFWSRLQASGLLTNEQQLAVDRMRAACGDDPLEHVRAQLVQRKLLTPWQDQQLARADGMTLKLGQYILLNHLGTGGMSRVYLAEHARLKRRVAIKVLPVERTEDRSYLRRFHREARAIAQLDHPNIVRAYGCDSQGELHYLVMEYVPGMDLDRLVRKSGVVDPRLAADYIRQAAVGLAHAHERGMIHRDIKPANLLLDRKQVIKILDLGLARLDHGGEESSVTLELRETVLGTVDFMAPEQAIDSHGIDARADIYSLGYTLYYLLVGKPPFPSGTLAQRLLRHQTVEPVPEKEFRPDVPAGLIALRERMTAKKPGDRFASMNEVAAAFDAWIGNSQTNLM